MAVVSITCKRTIEVAYACSTRKSTRALRRRKHQKYMARLASFSMVSQYRLGPVMRFATSAVP
jgi:hypothetical protein